MITITGATGQLGSTIINFLIGRGLSPSEISALVRSEEKAQDLKEMGVHLKKGNYNDYMSLVNAFKNTDKLLLISSNEMENRSQQHINAVNAAKEAGVKHILYTSIQRKTEGTNSSLSIVLDSHVATENAIKKSGMKYTMLRNNLYMDNLPWILGMNVFETGIIYPAKDGRIAYATRNDMAEAIAIILMDDNMSNKEYNLSNTHSVSYQELADYLSQVSGKNVAYMSPDVDTYKEILAGMGVPTLAAEMLAGFAIAAYKGELEAGNTDLSKILNREPSSYKDYLNSIFTGAEA